MSLMRRVIFWLAVGIPVLMAILVVLAARDAARMARWDHVQSGMSSLARTIDLYRLEHGDYPPSLERLLTSSAEMRTSFELTHILSNRYGDRYTYHVASNGFVITVTPTRWIMKSDPLKRHYTKGEVLK